MRRINSSYDTQLVYKSGGGCAALFGLPFFAFGVVFVIAALTGGMKMKGGGNSVVFPALFGAVFALVGAAIIFGRSGLVFDSAAKTVRSWWGLLFPLKSTTDTLSDFLEVRIDREQRKNKNSTYTVYPVRLVRKEGKALHIDEARNEEESRRLAEEIAKFIDFPVTDASSGQAVRRGAGTLDESLRDQLSRTGEVAEIPAPPPRMHSIITAEGNRVLIEIAPLKPKNSDYFPFFVALVFSGFVFFVFLLPLLLDSGTGAGEKGLFGAFIGGLFIALPLLLTLVGIVRQRKRSWTIEATPESLTVTERGLTRAKTQHIPSLELEELRVEVARPTNQLPCLTARSDTLTLRFAEGLAPGELRWLRQLLLRAVTT